MLFEIFAHSDFQSALEPSIDLKSDFALTARHHPALLSLSSCPRSTGASLGLSLAIIALAPLVAFSQDSPLPKDPKQLLLLAVRSNSLAATDMRPWHLKISFKLFDQKDSEPQQGALEEFWASPLKVKQIYSGSSFSQADYVTEKGRFRSGAQTNPPILLSRLEGQFTTPVSASEKQVDQLVVQREERKDGDGNLVCATISGYQTPAGVRPFPAFSYCLEPNRPALLLSEPGSPNPVQFRRNNITSFQGRFVPGDVVVVQDGKKLLEAHVEQLEQLEEIKEADLTPPDDAKPVPLRVNISAGVAAGMIQQKTIPEYPANAKAAGVSGTVVLQVLIGKDGRIADLHVIGGPGELQRAAVDAVRTWTYKPYLLNGAPVEVSTTVNVVFALSH